MKQSDSPKPFGYIYRIFHESMMHRDSDGNYYQPCYVGRTEESIHKRFLGHKRDARSVRGSTSGGDGKLHSKMWAENCVGFKVEELAIAYSPQELAKLEAHYIKHHDSIRKGWNKITASQTTRSRGESVLIVIDGKKRKFESLAQMCRQLEISNTSLNHWIKKKELSLSDAVLKAIDGEKKQEIKDSIQIEVFKRTYESFNAIARDKKINKQNLTALTIRRRVSEGMSIEEALSAPKLRNYENIEITLPNHEVKSYKTLQEAHNDFVALGLEVAPYSTVVSFLKKGQTLEQAFGFSKRPWELSYEKFDELVLNHGYAYEGEKSKFSDPIVVEHEKKIYTSVKLFAKTYGLDYSNISKKINLGWTVEKILKKSGHIK